MSRLSAQFTAIIFGLAVSVQAGVTLGIPEGDEYAGYIGGFSLKLNDAGLEPVYTAPDKAPLAESVNLESITLIARRNVGRPGMNSTEPLRLKIYDSAARKTLIGESADSFRWDPDNNGVAAGAGQTYRFTHVQLRTDKAYAYVFETAAGEGKPVGSAGLQVRAKSKATSCVILKNTLSPVLPGASPLMTFRATGVAGAAAVKPAPAPVVKAPAETMFYRVQLRGFDAAQWPDVKASLLAVNGVETVTGKRTGEILITRADGKPPVTRAAVDTALKAHPGLSVGDFTPLASRPD